MEPPLSVGNSNDRARDSSLHRQSAIQPGATAVSYTEPSEDDNEEEQLFIETIRRGALAVQQRRRRLLEGPPRSRPTPQLEAEEQERSDDGAGDAATGRDITSLAPAGMHPRAAPHSLLSTSLLAAHLDNLRSPSAEILRVGGDTTSRATARSDATPPMLLLYCDSLSMNLSLASLSSGLQSPASGAPAAVETTRRSAFPRSTLAPLRYSSPSSSGGCGKLVCARGFQSIKHGPNAFSSDAHPSHLLVDWLDILPGKEEESRWNDMCGCLYATLGCRNWYVESGVLCHSQSA